MAFDVFTTQWIFCFRQGLGIASRSLAVSRGGLSRSGAAGQGRVRGKCNHSSTRRVTGFFCRNEGSPFYLDGFYICGIFPTQLSGTVARCRPG
jgi:hypothetical protein